MMTILFFLGGGNNPFKFQQTGRHFSTTHELLEAINIEWNNTNSSSCKNLSANWERLFYAKLSYGK